MERKSNRQTRKKLHLITKIIGMDSLGIAKLCAEAPLIKQSAPKNGFKFLRLMTYSTEIARINTCSIYAVDGEGCFLRCHFLVDTCSKATQE